jgi:hypothetical protein
VTLVDAPPPSTRHEDRRRWLIVAVAAAAIVGIVVGGLVIATGDNDPATEVPANQPDTVAPPTTVAQTSVEPLHASTPPVEFTACIDPGPVVHEGTDEQIIVPLADGDMTIDQSRGFTYRQSLTEVSDPRLEGTLYQASDSDVYTLPGNEAGPEVLTFTDRIENDEGAWQGSVTVLTFPDRSASVAFAMVGEGAFEGLTAMLVFEDFWRSCAVSGYIFEGSVPAPPVPQTGRQ